jgi:hypothetical protein
MNPKSSWITIFSREAQKARLARFQIGLVEKVETSDVFVSLVACLVNKCSAEHLLTNVKLPEMWS